MAIHREYWTFNPKWLEYVKNTWVPNLEGDGRVQQIKTETPESTEFKERARQAFEARGVQFKTVKTYLSIQIPKDGQGYDDGYPHIHYPLDAMTLVHYLQTGDKPAPLHIINTGTVIEEVIPEQGMTVFMPNNLEHGVLKNGGTQDRIQLIATALR
tara:strand:+ start:580 stop:1047 length:468 start_codon:yes stop_codon:yes gene_type:complete